MILTQAQKADQARGEMGTKEYPSGWKRDYGDWLVDNRELLHDALSIYAAFQRHEIGYLKHNQNSSLNLHTDHTA